MMNNSGAVAIIDAALPYGASRWYRGIHHKPANEWDKKYKAADDKSLFLEFLHVLVLYERLVMDNTSVTDELPAELEELFAKIGAYAGKNLLERKSLAPYGRTQVDAIAQGTCRLISNLANEHARLDQMLSLKLPWAYNPDHYDYGRIARCSADEGLDTRLIPFALFSFRGLCYSGFANNYARIQASPAAYVASPGRMAALQSVIDNRDLKRVDFARRAYGDLVELLRLPDVGYDFTDFTTFYPHEVSYLTLHVSDMPPRQALKFAIEQRIRKEGTELRQRWAERIWAKSQAPALGSASAQQHMSNIRAGGNVTQIIYASPVDL